MRTPLSSNLLSRRRLLSAAASVPLTTDLRFAGQRSGSTATPRHVVIVGSNQLDSALKWTEIITEFDDNGVGRGTLLGIDRGDPVSDRELLRRIPDDASNLVLAVGREELFRLERGTSGVMDTFTRLSTIAQQFAAFYSSTLEAAFATGIPLTVCTLMGERNADPFRRRIANVSLAIANDSITLEASRHDLPMLDMRLVGRSATPRKIASSLLIALSQTG